VEDVWEEVRVGDCEGEVVEDAEVVPDLVALGLPEGVGLWEGDADME